MKNRDILLEVIGDTDEKLVPDLTAKKKKSSILKWATLGGMCAAAVFCAVLLPKFNQDHNTISPYGTLPQTYDESIKPGEERIKSNVIFGGMGFEGLMAYDISELDTPNPWTPDSGLTSMPVYRNLAYNDVYIKVCLSEDQMKEIAQNTASLLKTKISDMKVTYVRDFVQGVYGEILNGVYSVDAKCGNDSTITVYGDGQIRILFDNNHLPADLSFTYRQTTAEQAQETLKYLANEYAGLLGFDAPEYFSYADRTYSGEEIRSYFIFNRSQNMVQSILNYNLSCAQFAPNDSGDLMCIWLNNPYCSSEYIGDYPIISETDAKNALLSGSYYSSVPKDYIRGGKISESDIAKTELVYRNNSEEYYQPYYKFYVELDTTAFNMAENLKNYGIFYVPAVEADYLDDFTRDVKFN